jgi:hypothetical protein
MWHNYAAIWAQWVPVQSVPVKVEKVWVTVEKVWVKGLSGPVKVQESDWFPTRWR